MPDWQVIADALDAHIRGDPRRVHGGDISAAWRVETDNGTMFVKTGSDADMFAAEADGLRELAMPDEVRVPDVHGTGRIGDLAYIAIEWLDLETATPESERCLGQQLACLHRHTSDRFGWFRDNTIGLTPQINTQGDDWVEFFRDHRLVFQLKLASSRGYGGELQRQGAALVDRMPALFDGYEPSASLLHGDLWGGNHAAVDGAPVIFDPAVYYGDRESDIAMTQLFGGFGRNFYEAYCSEWPFEDGHEARLDLYQLYHVLNHLNLFGSGYLGRAEALLQRLLRAVS